MNIAKSAAIVALISCSAKADAPWTDNGQEPRLHWKPSITTIVTHSLAIGAMAFDGLVSIDGQHREHPLTEVGVSRFILGEHPSDTEFVAFFLGAVVVHTGIWFALPDEMRPIFDMLTIVYEIPCIESNTSRGSRPRFPFTTSMRLKF